MITGAGTMQSETITTTTNTSQSRMAFLSPTIVDVASNNFVYLTAAIDSAGLRDTLESGEYTLFAPNDGAFITLTNELGMSPDELLSNPRLLEVILSYHVIPGRVRVEDITAMDANLDTSTLLGPALSFGMGTDVNRINLNGGAASKKRADLKREVITPGLNSDYVLEAIDNHEKLLKMIDDSSKSGKHLAGDDYSLADAAAIPYILRLELLKLSKLWDRYPGVAKWWERVKHRPSTDKVIWSRMSEADWAPFKSISDEPWSRVKEMVKAA
jgi:uncharacterized surface protein with fasciclin (FAS1) repeats